MDYVYEGRITRYADDDWLVTFPAFPEDEGCFAGGFSAGEACESAVEVLRLTIADMVKRGKGVPESVFSEPIEAVFSVQVDDDYIAATECMTFDQTASELGVGISRVSQMVSSGRLDAREVNGRKLVTIESVNRFKETSRKAGRPKRELAST